MALGASESPACQSEEFDFEGRLWHLKEGEYTASPIITEYQYDPAGHLTLVHSGVSGGTWGQQRAFNFDGRGLMYSETQPENGAAGNVTYTYSYDARGHVRGKNAFTYTYDPAERLTFVTDPTLGFVKSFGYASSNASGNYKLGKLETATRHNASVDGVSTMMDVVDTYAYGGVGGRVSSKMVPQQNLWTVSGRGKSPRV